MNEENKESSYKDNQVKGAMSSILFVIFAVLIMAIAAKYFGV